MARTVIRRAGGEQTREKILAVAERLFAAAGFDGVSMRQVGAEAEIPFALVTYHFETKLGLYKAVFRRRSVQIATQRVDHLRSIELGPDARANFTAIARGLVEPLMRVRELEGGHDFGRLMAREVNDPVQEERGIVKEYFDPIAAITVDLLQKAAPDAPLARIYWSYHFAIGALAANHADTGRLERISGGLCRSADLEILIDELVRFMVAGLLGSLQPEYTDRGFRTPLTDVADPW